MKRTILALCIFITLSSLANAASIFKCVDSKGHVIMTTNPPQDAVCEGMGAVRDLTPREQQQIESERARRTEQARQEAEQSSRPIGCEIVSFSQRDVGGGETTRNTYVDLTIRNNDNVEKKITNANLVAATKRGKYTPRGFSTTILPGGTYKGTISFSYIDVITEMKCEF